jgi:predicted O-methyltransferase YrrM
MTPWLATLLAELERFGAEPDRATADRSRRMLNITRATGEFLAVLVRATAARNVLEIGTSNGYSTLWLAEAVATTGGHVTTLEHSAAKVALAQANFQRAGPADRITVVHADAARVIAEAQDAAWDLIFLDADRARYPAWWPQLKRILRPGGLLVADNATSHPEEMAPFLALVRGDPQFTTCLVPPRQRRVPGGEIRQVTWSFGGAGKTESHPQRRRHWGRWVSSYFRQLTGSSADFQTALVSLVLLNLPDQVQQVSRTIADFSHAMLAQQPVHSQPGRMPGGRQMKPVTAPRMHGHRLLSPHQDRLPRFRMPAIASSTQIALRAFLHPVIDGPGKLAAQSFGHGNASRTNTIHLRHSGQSSEPLSGSFVSAERDGLLTAPRGARAWSSDA